MPYKISKPIFLFVTVAFSSALAARPTVGAQLTIETLHAFDKYLAAKEARNNRNLATKQNFFYIDRLPRNQAIDAYSRLYHGQILVQRVEQCSTPPCTSVPGGLIHDWVGIVFVPGISLSEAMGMLQDYDQDAIFYPSEVMKSKLLAKSGNEFHIYLRLKQVHIITVVLDTKYDIQYTRIDRYHEIARSRSTSIAEVDHAGKPDEHDEPAGQPGDKDHGFLWRLDSYWRFYQTHGGVYIQCNAVSLTRDVPSGLGWLFGSFIESIPESSLRSTLSETRSALLREESLQKENSQ